MKARFRMALAGWWSRSIVSRWRGLPHNARLASVAGMLLIVALVAAGIAVKSQPSVSQANPSVSQAPTSVVADASSPGTTPSAQPSVRPDYSSWPTGWITSPPTYPPATPSPTPLAPITAATLATFPCKPYGDDDELAVSGGLLYLFCRNPADTASQSVVAIDLQSNRIVRTYDFEYAFEGRCMMNYCDWDDDHSLAVDHGLWVGGEDGIERLDLATGQASMGHSWQFLAHSPGRIWVEVQRDEGADIQALDPNTGKATKDAAFHHSNDAWASVQVCAAMVLADTVSWSEGDVYTDSVSLLTPSTSSAAWPIQRVGESHSTVSWIGQADGGCWMSTVRWDSNDQLDDFYLARLGLDGIELTTDIFSRDADAVSVDVRFYEGRAWLVRETQQGTYIQRLALPSLTLLGRPMRVPVKWLGIAGGSIWARNTQGYLVRLGLNGATPAPRTPSPKPSVGPTATPTVAPTPTAGPSS
jgi:hypothetical protein